MSIVGDWVGIVHLGASVLALLFGTWVLLARKGTTAHRTAGYVYAAGMTVLIITAFMIYRLFGGFGIFHAAALVSLITLICGMVPAIRRKPERTWLTWHYTSMYWSVMGLYAAFVAEVLTRIPQTRFYWMVGLGTFGVMAAANVFFLFYKNRWGRLATVYAGDDPTPPEAPAAAR